MPVHLYVLTWHKINKRILRFIVFIWCMMLLVLPPAGVTPGINHLFCLCCYTIVYSCFMQTSALPESDIGKFKCISKNIPNPAMKKHIPECPRDLDDMMAFQPPNHTANDLRRMSQRQAAQSIQTPARPSCPPVRLSCPPARPNTQPGRPFRTPARSPARPCNRPSQAMGPDMFSFYVVQWKSIEFHRIPKISMHVHGIP